MTINSSHGIGQDFADESADTRQKGKRQGEKAALTKKINKRTRQLGLDDSSKAKRGKGLVNPFSDKLIADFVNESYKQDLNDVNDDYIIDKQLSNDRVKVYQEKRNPKNAVIVHRGSYDTQDWLDNHALLRTGRVKSTKSYQIHADLHENAVKKYGADNLVGIGHSRGAAYLSLLNRQQPLKHSIVYNKPTWTYDFGRKMMPNETNIRTSNDVVSLLRFLERGKNKRTIQLNTLQRFNPIYAHSTYGLSM